VENARSKKKEKKGSNRKDDYEHKKGFGDSNKKGERREKVIMVGRIKYGKGSLRIIGIYVNGDMKKKLEELKEYMKEREEGVKTIIGGDFKARTGREEG